jgi:putative holliday junction resolvase
MLDITVIGFDFGMKRVGVALGKTLINQAKALDCLYVKDGVPIWTDIDKLVEIWKPDKLLVGIPTHVDGAEQPITFAARKFAEKLRRRFHIEVVLVDERYTTVEARQALFEEGGFRHLKNSEVDSVAAKVIIEHWMSTLRI